MISMLLLVCFASMPFLVEAEIFRFKACNYFRKMVDDMAMTQAGAVQLSDFFNKDPTVILWHPNDSEADRMCLKLKLTPAGKFEHKYFTTKGDLITHEGNAVHSTYPNGTFKLTATDPANKDPATDKRLPYGTLTANSDGVANMFPLKISDNEVIIMNCLNTFFGCRRSVYVLTTQDMSALDTDCAISKVKDVTGITVKSAGDMTACKEMYSKASAGGSSPGRQPSSSGGSSMKR